MPPPPLPHSLFAIKCSHQSYCFNLSLSKSNNLLGLTATYSNSCYVNIYKEQRGFFSNKVSAFKILVLFSEWWPSLFPLLFWPVITPTKRRHWRWIRDIRWSRNSWTWWRRTLLINLQKIYLVWCSKLQICDLVINLRYFLMNVICLALKRLEHGSLSACKDSRFCATQV